MSTSVFTLGERALECRGEHHFIAHNATIIGDVVLENNANVWFNTVIRADNNQIIIGENSNVQDGSMLHTDAPMPLRVGKNVTIGHHVMLHGCTIGDGCLIGMKSVILNNAMIGENCLIGANSLVTEGKQIPPGSLVMGSPAKVVRQLSADEISKLKSSADHYVSNAKRYLTDFKPDSRY